MSLTFTVYEEVKMERQRQIQKWGEQNHAPIEWMAILTEEVGEAAREALEDHWAGRHYEGDPARMERYRSELIQVAAVAVAAIEALDKKSLAR